MLPIPQALQGQWSVPLVHTFLPKDTEIVLLIYWLQLPSGHFGHFVFKEYQDSKGVTIMGGTNDPAQQEDLEILIQNGSRTR